MKLLLKYLYKLSQKNFLPKKYTPTDLFTIKEPQNPRIGVSKQHKKGHRQTLRLQNCELFGLDMKPAGSSVSNERKSLGE